MENADGDALYEIHLRGPRYDMLLRAFPTLSSETRDGNTALRGCLNAKSALRGALAQVEALGPELLGVRRLDLARPEP